MKEVQKCIIIVKIINSNSQDEYDTITLEKKLVDVVQIDESRFSVFNKYLIDFSQSLARTGQNTRKKSKLKNSIYGNKVVVAKSIQNRQYKRYSAEGEVRA